MTRVGRSLASPRMRWRNPKGGYGAVTKLLHWLTVLAVAAQFVIGYSMDVDSAAGEAEDRVDAREDLLEDAAEGMDEAAEERLEAEIERLEEAADAVTDSPGARELDDLVAGRVLQGGINGGEAHVAIGLLVMFLGVARLLWRRVVPLPPWAEHLSEPERRFEGMLEKVLLTMLLVVPATGLAMVLTPGDDLLPVHIAAQVALLTAVALHVGLVAKHTVVHRHGHLSRML